eukprot:5553881-Pyramimonas_sp.AAC.1
MVRTQPRSGSGDAQQGARLRAPLASAPVPGGLAHAQPAPRPARSGRPRRRAPAHSGGGAHRSTAARPARTPPARARASAYGRRVPRGSQ